MVLLNHRVGEIGNIGWLWCRGNMLAGISIRFREKALQTFICTDIACSCGELIPRASKRVGAHM
jgi:hypothetical protein